MCPVVTTIGVADYTIWIIWMFIRHHLNKVMCHICSGASRILNLGAIKQVYMIFVRKSKKIISTKKMFYGHEVILSLLQMELYCERGLKYVGFDDWLKSQTISSLRFATIIHEYLD